MKLTFVVPTPGTTWMYPAAAGGGDDLRTMYIITAWKGLSKEQLAGGLFATRVGTAGVAPNEVRYDG